MTSDPIPTATPLSAAEDWIDHLPGVTSVGDLSFGELMVPVSAIRQHFAALPEPEPTAREDGLDVAAYHRRMEALCDDLQSAKPQPSPWDIAETLRSIWSESWTAATSSRPVAPELRAALANAYAAYARSSEGAGSVQPPVVQRLIESVFDFLASSSVTPAPRPAIDGVQYVIVSPGQPIDSATGEPLGYNEVAVNGVARQSLAQLIETATANGLSVRLASSDEARALRLGSAVER